MSDEPQVFARAWPRWLTTLQLPLGILSWGPHLWIPLLIDTYGFYRWIKGFLQPWEQHHPVPEAVFMTVVAAYALLPLVLNHGLVTWARLRYGRCEVHPGEVRFEDASFFGRAVVLRPDELLAREETAHGLLVRARGRSRIQELLMPLFVPAPSEPSRREAQAAFEALIRRAEP